MSKDKAIATPLTKKAKDEDKEFSGADMTVEGTKGLEEKPAPKPEREKPLTIGDLLPGLRAKGMKI
jgi:hypothetical protein